MVNYKITNEQMVAYDTPLGGTDQLAYVCIGGDILELKTSQIVAEKLPMKKAKEMLRHLNFGGAFDGTTPAFFLQKFKNNVQIA
jgi:hypothetical protein